MTTPSTRPMLKHVEFCMGTAFSFHVAGTALRPQLEPAIDWLHSVDRTFSTYLRDSEISRLARGEVARADCSADVQWVLSRCDEHEARTNGFFSARASGRLDPSGLVKGWAIERAGALLLDGGLGNHMINGGGDVQCHGEPSPGQAWRIGIQDPSHRNQVLGVVEGRDMAAATSGTTERGNHIYDPHTGKPAIGLRSVTVIGATLTLADVYATTAIAMGDVARDWLVNLSDWRAFVVPVDGAPWST